MKIRKAVAAFGLAVMIPALAACGAGTTASSPTVATATSSAAQDSTSAASQTAPAGAMAAGGGPGDSVDVSSVTTEAELVALIQDAYGDGGLDLHRGHRPVQDVLDEVLAISHDELHVRMEEQSQNLATVAQDISVDPQTLIDALVASRSSAIDNLVAAGTITQVQADAYLDALEEAFTFRVTWDGVEEMPTFSGVDV